MLATDHFSSETCVSSEGHCAIAAIRELWINERKSVEIQPMRTTWLSIACFAALLVLVTAECPHLTSGLSPWSTASSWTSNSVPAAGADVVIPSGKKILLDVSPPDLNTLTIEADAQLVWSPAGDYELRSNYILVKGRFDIGSEDCKFDRKAIITLLGKVGTGPTVTGFGRKFLGVAMGGTIELHGVDPSPAWTRLAKTAHSGVSMGGSSLGTLDRGFNIAVFSAEGVQLAYRAFDLLDNSTVQNTMAEFLNQQPQGSIIAAGISDAISPNTEITEATFQAFEAFGAKQIRQRNFRDSYALIGVKGGDAVENFNMNATIATISREFKTTQGHNFKVEVQSLGWVQGPPWPFTSISLAYFGETIIDLVDEVNWKAGDKIVLGATDYAPEQSEEATIIACPECSRRQVKISQMPKYMHYGEITDCVDERGEVGLLTRNIVVRGEVENACYGLPECDLLNYGIDLYGGHFKVMKGFVNAHIEGVEFYKMGQQILGNYPIHFHMCGDVDQLGGYANPAYVKKNSVHRSLSRCVTIHGTNGLFVQDNVAFDHIGHCIFLEDGIERRNVIDRNLALWTRFGTLLPSDRSCDVCKAMKGPFSDPDTVCSECLALSTYWLTHPDNVLTNNVAGGSDFVGIWYIFPERPTGESEPLGIQLGIRPAWSAMGVNANNTAHSNRNNGMFIDNGIKAGEQTQSSIEQHLGVIGARFNPRVNFTDRNSARAPAIVQGYKAYKNANRGAWVRGGDIWFEDSVFADNAIGLTLASEGAMPNDPGSHQSVVRSLFVGQTGNKGQKDSANNVQWDDVQQRTRPTWYTFPVRGFEFYDGPLRVEDVGFKGFLADSRHNGSAIGNLLNNNWQMTPTNYIRGARFYDNSRRVYHGSPQDWFGDLDGDRKPVIHDVDGSLTGVTDSFLVRNLPFYTTHNCYPRPDWEGQICKERYGQLFIRNANSAGTNYNGVTTGRRFTITRDDNPDAPHAMLGIPSEVPTVQWQPLVMLSKGYTVKFTHPTPPQLTFQLTNWNARDWARLGVCYPPATFTVTKEIGYGSVTTLTQVSSIQEVDNSVNGTVYYYDSARGVLFFKAVAENSRNGYEFCASKGCEVYRIKAEGAQVGTNYACTPYPTYQVAQVGCDGGNGRVDQCGVCNGNGDTCQLKISSLECRDYGIYPPSNENPSTNGPSLAGTVSGGARVVLGVFAWFLLALVL